MEIFRIFVVEDDVFYGQLLKRHLELNPDNEVHHLKTGNDCLQSMHLQPSMISLDYRLPDISGMEVLKKLHADYPDIPVIIVSGQEDINTAVDLLKEGAYDYFVKDDNTKDRLWNAANKVKENFNLKKELIELKSEITKKYEFSKIIKGNSSAIKHIFTLMEKAAKSNITVSVSGETGTGKELVAKAIHYNSPQSKHRFVGINVSAIPKELIESEMFGHEKGAFTGAAARRIGKFELANKGTLFLDEIAEMDINMQTKLLRVLQEKEITRVGGNSEIKVDPRIIVATNKKLKEEVKKGNFREDLYYRLLGLPIELPPLRQRENDILILAKYFADQFCKDNGFDNKEFSQEAKRKLIKYPYPGNVRELRAIIELSVVLADGNIIDESHINFNSSDTLSDFIIEDMTLAEYERKIIKYFLEKNDNNVVLTAKRLGIGKSTIYRLLKEKEL
ncbi:MAG: regulator [Marinilabiliales bacterium]|nr:MAG: regulator [Marinilabiliales bacterium]